MSDDLFNAAYDGKTEEVKRLLKKGADINKAENDGRTPLLIAAEKGHSATVQLLLEKGAEIDKANNVGGFTPLYIAAQEGHSATVQLLLEKGADINKATKSGDTPLSIAEKNGHSAIVQLLSKKRAEIDQANKSAALRLSSSQNAQVTTIAAAQPKPINSMLKVIIKGVGNDNPLGAIMINRSESFAQFQHLISELLTPLQLKPTHVSVLDEDNIPVALLSQQSFEHWLHQIPASEGKVTVTVNSIPNLGYHRHSP